MKIERVMRRFVSSLLWQKLVNWAVLHLSPRHKRRVRIRSMLARRYIQGGGLEIGALHVPLALPGDVRVFYVDYLSQHQLRATYPELGLVPTVPVDVVDDGEILASITDASTDFIVANHVLEHCQNPLGTLENWLGKLSAGGILFITVPDMEKTFDRDRELTTIGHLLADYREGPSFSREEHVRELKGPAPSEDDSQRVFSSNPHYHVWTMASFGQTLQVAQDELGLPFVVEELKYVDAEFVAILRKLNKTRNSNGFCGEKRCTI